ncbi:MAG TPA: RNA polymerase sigma factor [Kribbella sp.]|uniref:RNA polymerase sigma factor n=1 Tax=Kribbella sp. TaxID=1871183 RepID=UPI002D776594|nr:RNA polymerase sigma factor [Kribbella sp.]HET6296471.1 RNA polymerase sigma factor [Kribbella sp.]
MTPDLALSLPRPAEHAAGPAPFPDTFADDSRLIQLSIREPDQFTQIFDRYFSQVHAYVARRLGKDIADDVSAETFLVAFRQRAKFDSQAGVVRAWLYGIATNLIRRHRRDEVRAWRAGAKLPLTTSTPGHEDRIAAQVTAQGAGPELAAALAKVSDKDREVLMLVALGGLSYEEVAAALGIAYGTVCSRLSRARRVVREGLSHTDPTSSEETR